MKKLLLMSLLAVAMTLIFSCSQRVEISDALLDGVPDIFPDYSDVTVPRNIAPLNFSYLGSEECRLVVNGNIQLRGGSNGLFSFPPSLWRKLVREPQVKLQIAVKQDGQWKAYRPFRIYVSQDEIDPFLSYRLIPPGYGGWKLMGLYQRNLLSYKQTPIYENRLGEDNCVNCHTPKDRDPQHVVFHARAIFGGTYVIDDGQIEKLDTKTDSTISNLVYPFWHPSGKYIAFSVNATKQSFFNHDPNRIEVFDSASDIVVYDVENHSICWSPLTKSGAEFETFPAFSPDGKYLYFCSARAVEKMPEDYAKAKYNLKRIAFDAATANFGDSLETVFDASSIDKSVSFPRVSPDGRHLVFTLHGYGNFSIWHRDADLWCLDLANGGAEPMEALNSDDVESYHSWSGNSRWLVFSSRRDDGLYTRLYISHIDREGKASKPFLLPQKNPREYYENLLYSYNIPEFMTGASTVSPHKVSQTMRNGRSIQVKVR
ncbi:MAG: hypothetical protein LKJ95_07735 [Bacteroidales bacterium]|jgi:hypothetical protein|nr:hypothetical protein [Bacteroidales bacterium]